MSWQSRIERARQLAERSPVAPDLLNFYQQIARFQASLVERPRPADLDALRTLAGRTASDPMHAFFARVLMQAGWDRPSAEPASGSPSRCPECREKPVAAVLRNGGEAIQRYLLCGRCFAEWEHPTRVCLNCGAEQLRMYSTGEFPHIRIEGCETCRVYLKTIDVTRDEGAVPEVDELASVELDLWAVANGYTKLQSNLFGM